jgi:hypothetical protein
LIGDFRVADDGSGKARELEVQMKRNVLGIVALLALAGMSTALADDTPAKCAAAKQKAVGKEVANKLLCYSKAVAKALPVDPECLNKATGKLNAAFVKADATGACTSPGDFLAQELAAGSAVARLAAAEAATPVPPAFGVPCGTTCGAPGTGRSAFLCAGSNPIPRPVCVNPAMVGVPCTGPLDCEATVGPGFICVTTAPGCGGGRFCSLPCP